MNPDAVLVQISNFSDMPVPATPVGKERRTSFTTHTLPGTSTSVETLRILPHAPNRIRATITIVGQSVDTAYLCNDRSNAQALQGMIVMGLQVIVLEGADEVHVSAPVGTNVAIGVAAEYAGG